MFRRQVPLSVQDRWIFGVFLAIVLGLFVAEICNDFQPAKLSALLVVLIWIPLLALHECGHAIAAALLNWYVGHVVIGMGRTVGSFRIGTAKIEIRMIPVAGFVRCVPRDLHLPHVKSSLIYFAGPAADLLAAAAVLLAIGPDRLFSASDDYVLIAWQSLALAGASQGIVNLIPGAVQTPETSIVNDGLGIIRSFLVPTEYYTAMMEHAAAWEAKDPADRWTEDD